MEMSSYLYLGIGAVVLLAIGSMFLGNPVATFNIIAWGSVAVVVPYVIASYLHYSKIRKMEDQMSAFLRDLSESLHSGLSLIQSLKKVSNNNYGPLNSELRRVANALNWGVDLDTALEKMRKRLSRSDKIDKILSIIIQTNKSGGEMYRILFNLSRDVQKLKEIEDEKRTLLSRHVMMIYAIYIIFILISIMLLKFLAPIITGSESVNIGVIRFGQDPCMNAVSGLTSFACGIFKGTTTLAGFSAKTGVISYYKGLMFWMIIIQGVFSGIVAGFIESSSPEEALKHSSIMLLIGFLSFYLSNITGLI